MWVFKYYKFLDYWYSIFVVDINCRRYHLLWSGVRQFYNRLMNHEYLYIYKSFLLWISRQKYKFVDNKLVSKYLWLLKHKNGCKVLSPCLCCLLMYTQLFSSSLLLILMQFFFLTRVIPKALVPIEVIN